MSSYCIRRFPPAPAAWEAYPPRQASRSPPPPASDRYGKAGGAPGGYGRRAPASPEWSAGGRDAATASAAGAPAGADAAAQEVRPAPAPAKWDWVHPGGAGSSAVAPARDDAWTAKSGWDALTPAVQARAAEPHFSNNIPLLARVWLHRLAQSAQHVAACQKRVLLLATWPC